MVPQTVSRSWPLRGWAVVGLVAVALAATGAWRQGQPEHSASVKEGWRVMEPLHYQYLHIFPIVLAPGAPQRDTRGYITLDEGLKSGAVEVTEVGGPPGQIIRPRPQGGSESPKAQQGSAQSEQVQTAQQRQGGAQVNRLWITNRSGKKLVLLAGELVVGGKQDRIVQKDMIVPPSDKPFDLSVFCVEQGRWAGSTDRFASFGGGAGGIGGLADPTVRGSAQAEQNQAAVWQRVGEKNAQAGASPASGTYQGALNSEKIQKDAKAYHDAIRPRMPANAVGAVIAIHGRIVWVDAFASADLFQRYWPKLLHSYVVDAITTPADREARPASERVPRVLRNPPTVKDATTFLHDWSGKSSFEGIEGVYLLTRIEAPTHVIFRLRDLAEPTELTVHFNKMRKR